MIYGWLGMVEYEGQKPRIYGTYCKRCANSKRSLAQLGCILPMDLSCALENLYVQLGDLVAGSTCSNRSWEYVSYEGREGILLIN